jgi:hypothetical protein
MCTISHRYALGTHLCYINADLLPWWLHVHSLLGVGYGEQYTTLHRMLSSRVLVSVTAFNEYLHERKQLIDKMCVVK